MSETPFTVDVLAQTTQGIGGSVLSFPNGPSEVEAHLVEVAPHSSVGRHQHPTPCIMFILEGRIVAELDDGTGKTYRAGEAFIEDASTWVNNRNPDDTPARFFAVVVGAQGEAKITF